VPSEWQWYIRIICHYYNFSEKIIIGMILAESTFKPETVNGVCLGLAQINKYWLRAAPLEEYRVTQDYKERDLLNPYDNIDTLIEMWSYARAKYEIDLTTEQGYIDLLYWHNTGEYRKGVKWAYANNCIRYANELKEFERSSYEDDSRRVQLHTRRKTEAVVSESY